MKTGGRDRSPWLVLLPAGCVFFLVVLPMLWMCGTAAAGGKEGLLSALRQVAASPVYRTVFLNTVWISVLVTGATLLLGYPIAFLLAYAPPRREQILVVVVIASMWLSVLLRSYVWTLLLQQHGLVNAVLAWLKVPVGPLSIMFTRAAVVIGMTHVLLPYAVLVLWTAMKQSSRNLENVAYSLGASRTFYFFRVFFPASRIGVLGAAALVFLLSLGFYITPALLGGGQGETMMIATLIEEQINTFGRWSMGSVLALLLCAAVLFPLYLCCLAPAMRSFWQDLAGDILHE